MTQERVPRSRRDFWFAVGSWVVLMLLVLGLMVACLTG